MGPWIYEHAPVSEDCGFCHVPHGSTADSLLEVNQPGACVSCHTLAESGAVHQPWAFTTACTDCHGAVHGSFTDPHLRR
jgi:predicted CXXCH cytochrome family protein